MGFQPPAQMGPSVASILSSKPLPAQLQLETLTPCTSAKPGSNQTGTNSKRPWQRKLRTSLSANIGSWFLSPSLMNSKPKASSLTSSSQFGHSRERGHQLVNSSSTRANSVPMEDSKLPTPTGSPSVQLCSGQLWEPSSPFHSSKAGMPLTLCWPTHKQTSSPTFSCNFPLVSTLTMQANGYFSWLRTFMDFAMLEGHGICT